MHPPFRTIATLLTIFALVSTASAQWGTVSGRVMFSGKPPVPKPLEIKKDKDFCGKHKLVDERLIVGPTGGLKNAIVMWDGPAPAKLHPSYAANAKIPVKLDNLKCRYEPHVVLLQCNQDLIIGNPDPIGHSVKIEGFAIAPISVIIPAAASKKAKFAAPERLPIEATCAIHTWMTARVVIKDHPYMAVTDAAGNFTIPNLPAGPVTLQFWHEEAGYLDTVTIGRKAQEWKKGRAALNVPDGETLQLGDVDVTGSFD